MKHHFHLQKRKRDGKKLKPFPHKDPKIRFLDRLILVIASIGPMANLPQIIKIFSTQNAAGISVFTFSIYAIFDIPWIIYGIVHKEKPIVISFSLWLITNLFVIAGALMYG